MGLAFKSYGSMEEAWGENSGKWGVGPNGTTAFTSIYLINWHFMQNSSKDSSDVKKHTHTQTENHCWGW